MTSYTDFGSGWNLDIQHIPWRWRHWRRLKPRIVYTKHGREGVMHPGETIWISVTTWNINSGEKDTIKGEIMPQMLPTMNHKYECTKCGYRGVIPVPEGRTPPRHSDCPECSTYAQYEKVR